MVKACMGANGFTPFVVGVAALSLYMYIALIESLNLDPLHATVQLGEGFNLVKFKLARFHYTNFNFIFSLLYLAWTCLPRTVMMIF